MAEEITRLIDFLIANLSLPDEWKCGNLTPVFKKDEDTPKVNYRPVSVLTALSKVYEKVMYDKRYNTFCRHLSEKPLWIPKEPFLLHCSSENDRGLENKP